MAEQDLSIFIKTQSDRLAELERRVGAVVVRLYVLEDRDKYRGMTRLPSRDKAWLLDMMKRVAIDGRVVRFTLLRLSKLRAAELEALLIQLIHDGAVVPLIEDTAGRNRTVYRLTGPSPVESAA